MQKQATLRLQSGLRFTATTGSGFQVELDSGSDGNDAAPSPMELQLVALAGCGAMDVISILRKMRQDVETYEVSVSGERATEHPRVYTEMSITHRIHGRAVREGSVVRAVELSMTRYCPIFAMLTPGVRIREFYEISDADSGAVLSGEVIPAEET